MITEDVLTNRLCATRSGPDVIPTTIQSDTAMRTVAVSDKPREVNRFSRMFDAMASNALPPRDTPKFLNQLVREIAE
ncbi:Scr1 family TA system antitoxin-like transcriptional regulator [Streptomyces sp. NPDC004539]|uniref:Scr1 family TA system antitoxin-like transcriptional regulator n=1 Tax=Streptomyces sp. NPDC004539 TaxID=3154280 RepID=UPI0033AA4D7A